MLDEKAIKNLRAGFDGSCACVICTQHFFSFCESIEALWKVALAARRWINAFPGQMSVDAEADLVKALKGLS